MFFVYVLRNPRGQLYIGFTRTWSNGFVSTKMAREAGPEAKVLGCWSIMRNTPTVGMPFAGKAT